MKSAEWIWYPGDFEVWLRREVELRRDERLVVTPAIWRVDSPCACVHFRKIVSLEKPERVSFRADGSLRLVIDGTMQQGDCRDILLSAGEHTLFASVANTKRFPALFVEGETVVSDDSWEVSHLANIRYLPAAADGFTNAAKPPADFHLETELLKAVSAEPEDGGLLVDFGRETFGYVRLHGVQGAGTIRLQYGESPEEARDAARGETYDVLRVEENGPQEVTLGHSRALRYVKVTTEGGAQVRSVSLLYEYLPVAYRGRFSCSNPLLNRIFEVAAYTFHLNTREFFLDGIKRDRWVWSGDAYQSYLMNYYLFFDQAVTRRTMTALRGKDPVEEHLNTILDYSFYWFLGLEDYYQYTGDLDFIRRIYPKMLTLMDFCVSRANADGFVEGREGDWVFVDWANMSKEGEIAFEQLLFCLSQESLARFATAFGDVATAARYKARAAKLRNDIRDVFWDSQRGAFIHRRANGKLDTLVTKHPNMFALMYGFLEPQEKERMKETVMKNPDVPQISTPYMRFYELAAMCEIGEHAYVLEEMLTYWGGMLSLGATSFWEEYDPRVSIPQQYAMYNRPYGKSLCHAWGASPIYLLGKYFLGVTPSAPGYGEILIRPHLGGLDWIEGAVPTPMGDVHIFMDREKIRASIPGGKAVLQFRSRDTPRATAGELTGISEGCYELRFEPSQTPVEVTY